MTCPRHPRRPEREFDLSPLHHSQTSFTFSDPRYQSSSTSLPPSLLPFTSSQSPSSLAVHPRSLRSLGSECFQPPNAPSSSSSAHPSSPLRPPHPHSSSCPSPNPMLQVHRDPAHRAGLSLLSRSETGISFGRMRAISVRRSCIAMRRVRVGLGYVSLPPFHSSILPLSSLPLGLPPFPLHSLFGAPLSVRPVLTRACLDRRRSPHRRRIQQRPQPLIRCKGRGRRGTSIPYPSPTLIPRSFVPFSWRTLISVVS